MILQQELISKLTEERNQNGERLKLALVDKNNAFEKYSRRLKRQVNFIGIFSQFGKL